MAKENLDSGPAAEQCDVLIITILPEEWDAFKKVFPEAGDKINTLTGFFGTTANKLTRFTYCGYSCIAATLNSLRAESKLQGKVPAAVFTSRLLSRFSPSYLVNIGIAARVGKDACGIGGVVIADSLYDLGNCAIIQNGRRGFRFQPTTVSIDTDWAVRATLVHEEHQPPPPLQRWLSEVKENLQTRAGPGVDVTSHSEGSIVSGEAVAKATAFRRLIQDVNRGAHAYEMESYAIAQTARLLNPISPPKLIVFKGLSDSGDSRKNALENSTKGEIRRVASEHAFRLLRVALELGTLGTPMSAGLLRAIEQTALEELKGGEPEQAFPFIQENDLVHDNLHQLADANDPKTRDLYAAVCEVNPAARFPDRNISAKAAVKLLNCAVRTSYWKSAYWRVREGNLRLAKVIREACNAEHQFTEHTRELVNRLLLENDFRPIFANETPIVTCLVENTGHHRALEKYKQTFEAAERVAIDFDAKPLDELFSESQAELFGNGGKYDLLFHYHTGVSRFFAEGVVSPLSETELETFGRALIPAVEVECCYVQAKGERVRVTIPVNANSMLLVANKDVFQSYNETFFKSCGRKLTIPSTWKEFEEVVEFFAALPDHPVCAFLPQGKREGDVLYYDWCNVAFGYGGGVFEKQHGWEDSTGHNILIDSPETIKATKLYQKLYDSCPADVRADQLDPKSHLERFARGDVALAFMWSDLLHELYLNNREAEARFSTHVLPGTRSMIGGGVCCISKKARSPNEVIAKKFVTGLIDPEVQSTLTALGWCSGFESVYSAESVKRLPYAEAVRASLARGVYMAEAGPHASSIRNVVGARLQQIMRDREDVESVLKSLKDLLRSRPWGDR